MFRFSAHDFVSGNSTGWDRSSQAHMLLIPMRRSGVISHSAPTKNPSVPWPVASTNNGARNCVRALVRVSNAVTLVTLFSAAVAANA